MSEKKKLPLFAMSCETFSPNMFRLGKHSRSDTWFSDHGIFMGSRWFGDFSFLGEFSKQSVQARKTHDLRALQRNAWHTVRGGFSLNLLCDAPLDPIPMSGWWVSGSPGFTAPQRVPPMFHRCWPQIHCTTGLHRSGLQPKGRPRGGVVLQGGVVTVLQCWVRQIYTLRV